jgi:hypothetical protein
MSPDTFHITVENIGENPHSTTPMPHMPTLNLSFGIRLVQECAMHGTVHNTANKGKLFVMLFAGFELFTGISA